MVLSTPGTDLLFGAGRMESGRVRQRSGADDASRKRNKPNPPHQVQSYAEVFPSEISFLLVMIQSGYLVCGSISASRCSVFILVRMDIRIAAGGMVCIR